MGIRIFLPDVASKASSVHANQKNEIILVPRLKQHRFFAYLFSNCFCKLFGQSLNFCPQFCVASNDGSLLLDLFCWDLLGIPKLVRINSLLLTLLQLLLNKLFELLTLLVILLIKCLSFFFSFFSFFSIFPISFSFLFCSAFFFFAAAARAAGVRAPNLMADSAPNAMVFLTPVLAETVVAALKAAAVYFFKVSLCNVPFFSTFFESCVQAS
eukprot:TRINITY_DN3828_c0_g1_i1.p1 TRINITY_DN3828_c0_g1~~TRINITY_DN3828_c0_g1_i1.p1  ORF type:complete len:212 (+),score=30.07 TRINITY_DN3828_c0_g1_i1:173-808(+)